MDTATNPNIPLKDNSIRSIKAIKVMKWYIVVLSLAMISSLFNNYVISKLINDRPIDDSLVNLSDYLEIFIGFAQLSLYVVTIVFFLNWFRRAYGNLHRMKKHLNYSEVAAAWSFFIPFINWVRPYKITREIVQELEKQLRQTYTSESYKTSKLVIIVGWWWTFWLIASFVNYFSSRLAWKGVTLQDFHFSNSLFIVSGFFELIAAFLIIEVIRKTSNLETLVYQGSLLVQDFGTEENVSNTETDQLDSL